MPQLTSDIEAKAFQLIPNSIQNAHVKEMDAVDPATGEIKKTKSGLGRQITLDWEIDEGEHAGKVVRFNNLTLGGHYIDKTTGEQKPLSTVDLCEFLTHTGVPWKCLNCNNAEAPRKFHIGTGPEGDGITKGKYVCPDCKNTNTRITYNTDNFLGARCGIRIGSKKQEGGDKEFNEVRGYAPLKTS